MIKARKLMLATIGVALYNRPIMTEARKGMPNSAITLQAARVTGVHTRLAYVHEVVR